MKREASSWAEQVLEKKAASLSPKPSTWLHPAGLSYEEIQIIQRVGERRERPTPFLLRRLLMSLTMPLCFEYGISKSDFA